jgi:DNA-binding transcriptional ArsR family regulator
MSEMTSKRRAKSPVEDAHPSIYKALSHPLRMRLLSALTDREASPKELSVELGEALGNVAYHMRMLEELGCIELVRTTPRRGAVEHHYRQVLRPSIGDDDWAQLPSGVRHALSAGPLAQIFQDVAEAQAHGSFDKRPERHLSHTPLALDDEAWEELSRLMSDLYDRARELNAETAARVRFDGSKPSRPSRLVMLHFEAAPNGSDRAAGGHGSA